MTFGFAFRLGCAAAVIATGAMIASAPARAVELDPKAVIFKLPDHIDWKGTFVTHYGGQVHWDRAKDEDTIILIVGEGPATITRVEEEK